LNDIDQLLSGTIIVPPSATAAAMPPLASLMFRRRPLTDVCNPPT